MTHCQLLRTTLLDFLERRVRVIIIERERERESESDARTSESEDQKMGQLPGKQPS